MRLLSSDYGDEEGFDFGLFRDNPLENDIAEIDALLLHTERGILGDAELGLVGFIGSLANLDDIGESEFPENFGGAGKEISSEWGSADDDDLHKNGL